MVMVAVTAVVVVAIDWQQHRQIKRRSPLHAAMTTSTSMADPAAAVVVVRGINIAVLHKVYRS